MGAAGSGLEMSSGPKLRDAWAAREPFVIEVAEGGGLPDSDWSRNLRWWELDAKFNIGGESLRFLAESNAVDARNAADPRFAPLVQAVHLGARRSPPENPGDAVSPSGWPIWCDGGPLAPFAAEDLQAGQDEAGDGRVGVVPAANLAVGSLVPIFPSDPEAELAADQMAAVAHIGGGARIVAPAGSGKTRVLTERARHLVRGLGVDPKAVCLVAYNKRAQEEMQDRLSDVGGLQVRTLNSLGLAICNGWGRSPAPADSRGSERLRNAKCGICWTALCPRRPTGRWWTESAPTSTPSPLLASGCATRPRLKLNTTPMPTGSPRSPRHMPTSSASGASSISTIR